MNHLERFKCICRGQDVDYVPIIGLPGASGVGFGGAWGQITQRLIETGMPESVKGWDYDDQWANQSGKSWSDFWGTVTPLYVHFWPGQSPKGIKSTSNIDGQYEVIEYQTGAITRQLIDNDDAYSMPEFIKYHVRDRQSWQLYKDLNTPGPKWSDEKIDKVCMIYDDRSLPLMVPVLSTWGFLRDIAGTELASTMLYDDPELAKDIINFQSQLRREYLFPLIKRLKPEIIKIGEDNCYNHGMLISPVHFEEFCGEAYTEINQLAQQCGAEVFVVDTDGEISQLLPLLEKYGANGVYPIEAKANKDIISLKKQHPDIIFFGGIEKEVINQGNEGLIESEITSKVPNLLSLGKYFPNIDHSLQPMCTFPNLCEFMKKLYKVTNNPSGKFYDYIKK